MGALLNIVASVLRWYGGIHTSWLFYWICMWDMGIPLLSYTCVAFAGQAIGALGQCLIGLNSITLFSTNWFAFTLADDIQHVMA